MMEKKTCGGCGCSKSANEKSSQKEAGKDSGKMSMGHQKESMNAKKSDSHHK